MSQFSLTYFWNWSTRLIDWIILFCFIAGYSSLLKNYFICNTSIYWCVSPCTRRVFPCECFVWNKNKIRSFFLSDAECRMIFLKDSRTSIFICSNSFESKIGTELWLPLNICNYRWKIFNFAFKFSERRILDYILE
jgi:hypothetical protein